MMNLKASLLKEKKLSSEKLRIENKKMELRLQQLKLAMCKEKEERLGTQSNWSSGTPGALLNYKPGLSGIDSGKRVKLKMLKDENLDTSVARPTKTNVLKDIGGGDTLQPRSDQNVELNGLGKFNFSRHCGQCEESLAAVNCKECAEDYCPKCFAAFHLKGALRKHRSTPISTLNNRVSIPSPLFKPPDFKNVSNCDLNQRKSNDSVCDKPMKKCNSTRTEDKEELVEHSKENHIPKYTGSSLADGTYNEELSNQYFQEAMEAWRNNVEITESSHPYPKQLTTEHSTETIKSSQEKKLLSDVIQFTPSLSYAEQLLLRKHRNNELAPLDMKYILARLTKTNEEELIENQKLLQSNLVLETSIIKNSTDNALKNDEFHIDFECVNQLMNDAELIGDRLSSMSSHAFLKSPFKVEELHTSCDMTEFREIQSIEREISNYEDKSDQKESKNNNNHTEVMTENYAAPKSVRSDVQSKRSKSALNKASLSDKPHSARRMSARNQYGGKITAKPSVLLDILANFSNYLPSKEDQIESANPLQKKSATRPGSANVSNPVNKISYNFYKLTPNSWKPSQAWSQGKTDEICEDGLKDAVINEQLDTEMENELERINLLSNHEKIITKDYRNYISLRTSSRINQNNQNLFNDLDTNYFDEESEKEEVFDQLNSLERDLTVISRQNDDANLSSYDDVLTDSLDIVHNNPHLDSSEFDKFCFEDSLDLPQSNSNTLREGNDLEDEDQEDDEMINCSSRFDDFDDVHKLN